MTRPRMLRTHLSTYYGSGQGVANEEMLFSHGLFPSLGYDEVFLPFEADAASRAAARDHGPYAFAFTMPYQGLDTWIREIVGPGRPIISWQPDDAWRFEHTRAMWQAGTADHFISTAPEREADYAAMGCRSVTFTNWGCRPDYWPNLVHQQETAIAKASFCGFLHGDRLSRLQALADVSDPDSGLVPVDVYDCRERLLSPQEYHSLIAESAFTIALTRSSVGPPQMKARLFEAALHGSVLVTEPVPGLDKWWESDTEVIVFHSPQEAQSVMQYLLAHPDQYQRIAQAALLRALRDHSFQARLAEVLDFLHLPVPCLPNFLAALAPEPLDDGAEVAYPPADDEALAGPPPDPSGPPDAP